jgi:integrase
MTLTPGSKLGPYEIISSIGSGGMGEVWKARDTRLGRTVAIKKVKEQHSERFKQEARSVAALNHPNICQIHDIGDDYLVLEYVEGKTKNGTGRIVYLNKSALGIIDSIPSPQGTKPTDLLFSDITPDQVSVAFKRACKRVGIEDFRFHDLRHTAASWLRMQGADIHTVAQLLGHKDLRMASRYQHLSSSYLSNAVSGLDKVFGDLRYHSVTAVNELPEVKSVNPLESWRPQRDSNPCCRIESAVS